MNKCCKTCALWNIKQAQDAAGRVRKDRVARCLWVSTEVYPSSIVLRHGEPRPIPAYTSHNNGTDCACWEPRA